MLDTILGYLALFLLVLLALDAVIVALFVWFAREAASVKPDIMGAPSTAAQEAAASSRMEAVRQAWSEIEASAAKDLDGKRLAVINADRLADRLLKDAGYAGEGALERMKALPREKVATAADLMAAHRFRNRLVHEVGFRPDERALDGALAQFRAFLTEVGYL